MRYWTLAALAALLFIALVGPRPFAVWADGPTASRAAAPTPAPTAAPFPRASEAVQKLLDTASQQAQQQQWQQAEVTARQALAAAHEAQDTVGEALAQAARAGALERLGRMTEALTTWRAAAEGLNSAARAASLLPDMQLAGALYSAAEKILRKEDPDSLELSRSLNGLGVVARDGKQYAVAAARFAEALALRQRLSPASPAVANTLANLGELAREQGILDKALEDHRQALRIRAKPDGSKDELANSLLYLGGLEYQVGELTVCREHFVRLQAVLEELLKGAADAQRRANLERDLANCRYGLGKVARDLGDYAIARVHFAEALRLRKLTDPDSLSVADAHLGLASVEQKAGKVLFALREVNTALAIQQTRSPDSLDIAHSLTLRALIEDDLRAWDLARQDYENALAIRRREAPGSLDVAESLADLGTWMLQVGYWEKDQGNLAEASLWFEQAGKDLDEAREIQGRLAPGSTDLAATYNNLGLVAREQTGAEAAEAQFALAWKIAQGPMSAVVGDEPRQAIGAATAGYVANLVAAQCAQRKYEKALATLEEGRAQSLFQLLAGHKSFSSLVSSGAALRYQQAMVAQHCADEALKQADSARIAAERALKDEQAKLDAALRSGRSLPTNKSDLEACQQRLQAAVAAVDQKLEECTQARSRAVQEFAQVKKETARSLPPAMALGQACASIPDDTLFVSFVVGDAESFVFVIRGRAPVEAYRLDLITDELKQDVASLWTSVAWEKPPEAAPSRAQLIGWIENSAPTARKLFQQLFPEKVRALLARPQTKRLVIVPDGLLWSLPFGSLVTNQNGPPQYLGLTQSLSYAQSLTLFAHSLTEGEQPPTRGPVKAMVVGNPLYSDSAESRRSAREHARTKKPKPGDQIASAAPAVTKALRSRQTSARSQRRGSPEPAALQRQQVAADPPQLQNAEKEADGIAPKYGAAASFGEEPTEDWFRQRARGMDLIHLATHGSFDSMHPMSSHVLLAVPEKPSPGVTRNDGRLEAWELMSGDPELQLKAELVVLSACETAMGENVRGEGLIGLTRALQVAGARSIVASQWKVVDESTEALMIHFHDNLRQRDPNGAPVAKDEALRRAMVAVANDKTHPEWSHPHYWAPFLLVGDPLNRHLARPAVPAGRTAKSP